MKTYRVTVSRPIFGREETTVTLTTGLDPVEDKYAFEDAAFELSDNATLWVVDDFSLEVDTMNCYEVEDYDEVTVPGQEKLDL